MALSANPKISVLMAVYNTDIQLVKRAVASVLCQSHQNFELIILDDGSEEAIAPRLRSNFMYAHHKIRYLRHANRGQAESINRGVSVATGDYITVIDSDDEYKPEHLESCLREMKGVDLIASTTETMVDDEGDYYVPNRFNLRELIHVDECILFATLFGTRPVFAGIRFEGSYAADAVFYHKASLIYNVKKVNLRTYIYYRNNPESTCAKLKKGMTVVQNP